MIIERIGLPKKYTKDFSPENEYGHKIELAMNSLQYTYQKSILLADGIRLDPTVASPETKEAVPALYQHTGEALSFKPPQEIILGDLRSSGNGLDGPFVVNIRANQDSPHSLTRIGGGYLLTTNNGNVVEVKVPGKPAFYELPVKEGLKVSQVVQKLGHDGIGVVPSNYCSYFSHSEQCRFCEIVPNYQTARVFPKARKPLVQMQEAITKAVNSDSSLKYLFITTGNDPTYDETYKHYIDLLDPLKDLLKENGVTTFGVLMPPDDFSLISKVQEAGLDSITFNLEVWNENLAEWMTPGKTKYGREKMMAALDEGVNVFGHGNALTNLVYGIQGYEPDNVNWKFDPENENQILLASTEQILARGVLPTHTVYHTSGVNPIGKIKLSGEKLFEYHMEYAQMAYKSGVVPPDRAALFAGVGTVSNSLFNDAYATVKLSSEIR